MARSRSTTFRWPTYFCSDKFRRPLSSSAEIFFWLNSKTFRLDGMNLSFSEERNFFSWGLSQTLVRLLPPLSVVPLSLNVWPGKFAMKRMKQNSYAAVATLTVHGARLGPDVIKEFAPAPFQS